MSNKCGKLRINAVNDTKLYNVNRNKWNTKDDKDKIKSVLENNYNMEVRKVKRVGICSIRIEGKLRGRSFKHF